MTLKTLLLLFVTSVLLILLGIAIVLPHPDAYRHDIVNRLAAPGAGHPFGLDELGRDLFSRFLAGSRFTILTALATALFAGLTGLLLARAAQAAPKSIGRLVVVLGYACFVLPSFLLAPRLLNRLLMLVLVCAGILPFLLLASVVITTGNLVGWMSIWALGPLWGIGIAYTLFHAGQAQDAVSGTGQQARLVFALMAAVFAWNACYQAMLDFLGLGVQPPVPSWGALLFSRSASWLPQAAAIGALLLVVIAGLGFSQMITSRSRIHKPGG